MSAEIDPIEALEQFARYHKLQTYLPYGHPDTLCPTGAVWQARHEAGQWSEWSNKPWQMDFHTAGASNTEPMLCCANRVGKTFPGTYETAVHLTGLYPDWWQGRRFSHPVLWWTGSPTNETSRDIVQKELLGGTDKENLGTGFIPRDMIYGSPTKRQCAVSDVVDSFKVKHVSGGVSTCIMKSYEQGWRKWQGTAPHGILLDEEPEDYKIYSEALTRLLTTNGLMMVTFTPLLGMTDLVDHFFNPQTTGIWLGTAGWDDVAHLDPAEKDRMAASYPAHEVEARRYGVPMMGEGRIFTEKEEKLLIQPFEIPPYLARICGVDFGIDHPQAAAWLAYDRDRDIIFLHDEYRESGKSALEHVAAINARGKWIPVAWPHDGTTRDKSNGVELKDYYRQLGANMLGKSARYKSDVGGPQPQWPIIEEMRLRMATGRFLVTNTCQRFFEEYRNFHMKDGKIVNKRDDLLKAVMYAMMMKRFAVSRSGAYVSQVASGPIMRA